MAGPAPWCTITIAHSYFAGGVATPLRLRPDADSAARMARHGLAGLSWRGGYTIYAADPALAAGLDGQAPLVFLLECDDAWFLNYTDIDQAPLSMGAGGAPAALALADAIFYADNIAGAAPLAPVFGQSARAVRPARFLWTAPAPLANAELEVRDRRGRAVWRARTGAPARDAFEIALAGVPNGAYTLLADGEPTLEFVLAAGPRMRPWGMVALFAPFSAAYVWQLAARRTIWRYTISSARLDLDGWRVRGQPAMAGGGGGGTAAAAAIAFAAESLGGTPPCWRYTAQAPLALAERPVGLNVVLARPGASASGAIRLPYARGDSPVQGGGDEGGEGGEGGDTGGGGISEVFFYL